MSEGPLTFLVVDDSSTSRLLTSRILEKKFNCRVLQAEDGMEGIEIATKENLDLIITDYNMPHVDGLGLIEAVRKKSPLNQMVPIILISAYLDEAPFDPEINQNLLFIKKPVTPDTLVRYSNMSLAMERKDKKPNLEK